MSIEDLSKNWEALAHVDPMWAIKSYSAKAGGRWDTEEFFQTGLHEVAELINCIGRLAPDLPRGKALDFGCGIGRVTKPLGSYFEHVWGVDIAKNMIERAVQMSSSANVTYAVNRSPNLAMFESGWFDFIYSDVVLQHMPPDLALSYIKEFYRTLKAGGVLVFQLPDKPPPLVALGFSATMMKLYRLVPKPLLRIVRKFRYPGAGDDFLASLPAAAMEMHGVKKSKMLRLLKRIGFQSLELTCDYAPGYGWRSWHYCLRKTSR